MNLSKFVIPTHKIIYTPPNQYSFNLVQTQSIVTDGLRYKDTLVNTVYVTWRLLIPRPMSTSGNKINMSRSEVAVPQL